MDPIERSAELVADTQWSIMRRLQPELLLKLYDEGDSALGPLALTSRKLFALFINPLGFLSKLYAFLA